MAATTDNSTVLFSSFLSLGTPTCAMIQSPRDNAGESTPRRKESWGNVQAVLDAEAAKAPASKFSIVALAAAAPPTTLNMSKRSWSTISFGEGETATDAFLDHPAALQRYISEDFMATILNREASDISALARGDVANAADAHQWTLGGIAEGSSSPTNVDFAPVVTGALAREKSTDFSRLDGSALLRAQSDDLQLLLLRSRSQNMLQSLGAELAASIKANNAAEEAPACPPPSTESAPPLREEDEDAASSSDTETEEEAPEEPQRRVSARNIGKPKRKLAELEDSDDDYIPPSSSKKGSKKAKKGGSHRTGGYAHNNRGAHVKGRPEMQETARNGQRHWATEVQNLRTQWHEARCWEANPSFQPQLELMARRHIKNQHECLLRALHIAAAKGMVDPLPFNNAEGKSFLGWTGFSVRPDKAAEFRTAVEEMFPQPLLENTLHNTFRRAGLVPSSWSDAWLGFAPFGYKKPVA